MTRELFSDIFELHQNWWLFFRGGNTLALVVLSWTLSKSLHARAGQDSITGWLHDNPADYANIIVYNGSDNWGTRIVVNLGSITLSLLPLFLNTRWCGYTPLNTHFDRLFSDELDWKIPIKLLGKIGAPQKRVLPKKKIEKKHIFAIF